MEFGMYVVGMTAEIPSSSITCFSRMSPWVQGLGFIVEGLGWRVYTLGFRVWGLRFKVYELGFRS